MHTLFDTIGFSPNLFTILRNRSGATTPFITLTQDIHPLCPVSKQTTEGGVLYECLGLSLVATATREWTSREIKAQSETPGVMWSPTAFSLPLATQNSSIVIIYLSSSNILCWKYIKRLKILGPRQPTIFPIIEDEIRLWWLIARPLWDEIAL